MKILGYCRLDGKEYVMFDDKRCSHEEFMLTDGFHDKTMRWNSEKMLGIAVLPKEKINVKRIVKRMKGSRPWHPLLKLLRKEAAV